MNYLDGKFWYAAPFLVCHRGVGHNRMSIPLPYADLPQTNSDELWSKEGDNLLELPPDDWRATFGCRECGLVDTYEPTDVDTGLVLHQTEGRFHSGSNCLSVELQCAKSGCKAPAILHVNMKDGESEKDLLRLLRADFFRGKLPCGHQVTVLAPHSYRDAHRVMKRLW